MTPVRDIQDFDGIAHQEAVKGLIYQSRLTDRVRRLKGGKRGKRVGDVGDVLTASDLNKRVVQKEAAIQKKAEKKQATDRQKKEKAAEMKAEKAKLQDSVKAL